MEGRVTSGPPPPPPPPPGKFSPVCGTVPAPLVDAVTGDAIRTLYRHFQLISLDLNQVKYLCSNSGDFWG